MQLRVPLLLPFNFIFLLLNILDKLSIALFKCSYFTLPLFLRIKEISIVYHFFVDFLQHSIRFFVFEYHSFHLNIELVIYLLLHFMVHRLHELLKNVLQVLNIDTFTYLLLEGFVDAHDIWRLWECCVVTSTVLMTLSWFLDVLAYLQDQSYHPIILSHFQKFTRLNVLSKKINNFPSEVMKKFLRVVITPYFSILKYYFIDEVLFGNGILIIKILFQKCYSFTMVPSQTVSWLLIFINSSTIYYWGITLTRWPVCDSAPGVWPLVWFLSCALLYCFLKRHFERRGRNSFLNSWRSNGSATVWKWYVGSILVSRSLMRKIPTGIDSISWSLFVISLLSKHNGYYNYKKASK